jgi:hypothetical protein
MLASVAAMSSSALAAPAGNAYGSVKLTWNVLPTLTAAVHTNYAATVGFANVAGNAVLGYAGTAGGSCVANVGNTDLTVDFGQITEAPTGYTACNYENAVATSVDTNDAAGFSVNEYVDEQPGSLVPVICAFPNGLALGAVDSNVTAANATTHGVAPAVYSGAACAAGGGVVPLVNSGGTLNHAGTAPAQPGSLTPGSYTGENYSITALTATGLSWFTGTITGTAVIGSEDLQLNLPNGYGSGVQTAYMTIQYVAN